MDMTASIIPKSDQLNADDLMTGTRTVTIEKVSAGSAEQPVDVHLREFPGRAFRPSKSMRRVMVAAWGADTAAYTGQRMTLYREPTIRFGRDEVGGIRISHMSGIDKALKIALTITRGKREPFTVEPLRLTTPSNVQENVQEPTPEPLGYDDIASPAQVRAIQAMFTDNGVKERPEKLNILSTFTGRAITSSKDLSKAEASKFLNESKLVADAELSVRDFWTDEVGE